MKNDSAYYRLAFKIFFDLSFSIAIPAVVAAIIGKRLDVIHGTHPRYLVIALLVAFVFTALFVIRKSNAYQKEFERIK